MLFEGYSTSNLVLAPKNVGFEKGGRLSPFDLHKGATANHGAQPPLNTHGTKATNLSAYTSFTAMGNQFARAKLLRAFRHLPSVPARHVQSCYETYKKQLNAPPFLTRNQFLEIFYPDLLDQSRQKKDKKKEQETIRADLQYTVLDRRCQGRVSALDIFVGLALLVHDSMENRIRFVFKLVDFTRNGALNMAELILLFGSALRGIARMKGIEDAEYWHCEQLSRNVFRKSNVHFRAGEGVGDYADGGVTLRMLVDWARDDSDARALLDNVDFGAYLSALLTKQQVLWQDLIDIRAAMQLKQTTKQQYDQHQTKVRNMVQTMRTTDPGTFQTPKMLQDERNPNKQKTTQELIQEKMDRNKKRKEKKEGNKGNKGNRGKDNGSQPKKKQRTPVWDTGPHTFMEKEQALALARTVYGIYGVLSVPTPKERVEMEYRERKIVRAHQMKQKKWDSDDEMEQLMLEEVEETKEEGTKMKGGGGNPTRKKGLGATMVQPHCPTCAKCNPHRF